MNRCKAHIFTVALLAMFVVACDEKPPSVFHKGQMVRAKLDGAAGMVVSVRCLTGHSHCMYFVRFVATTKSIPKHMLGSGGEIQNKNYSLHWMGPYEIDPA